MKDGRRRTKIITFPQNNARNVGLRDYRKWTLPDEGLNWALPALTAIAIRRYIEAGSTIFSRGDRASSYYFLERGELEVRGLPMGSKPAVRILSEGDLFIYDCDDVHVASCAAIVDSTVLRIDRWQMEQVALQDPVLKGVLHTVHARELTMILASTVAPMAETCPITAVRQHRERSARSWH